MRSFSQCLQEIEAVVGEKIRPYNRTPGSVRFVFCGPFMLTVVKGSDGWRVKDYTLDVNESPIKGLIVRHSSILV